MKEKLQFKKIRGGCGKVMAVKAKIIPVDGGEEIQVMYNPNEYSVSFEAKYSGEGTQKQFKITQTPEFKISLFYDTYEKGTDVRKETKKVTSLLDPTVSGEKTKRPKICLFVWGGFSYRGVISKIDQKFTMFLKDGTPVRSLMDVTFISEEIPKKEEDSKGLEACRKLWVVKSGERLDMIAHRALKDPTKWRKIAKLNKIHNPISFPKVQDIGRILVIPD